MNATRWARARRPLAIAALIILFALAVVLVTADGSSFLASIIAMGLAVAGFGVARWGAARAGRPQGGLPARRAEAPAGRPRGRSRRWRWTVNAALAALTCVAFWLALEDEAHGGHAVWPLYVFAGLALVGAVWSVLGKALLRRQ